MSRSFAMSYKDFDKGWSKVPRKIIRWLFPRKRPDNQESMDKSVGKEAVSDKFTRKSKDKSVKNVEEKLVGKSKEKLIKKTNDQLPQRSKNKSVKKKNPKSTQKSNDQPEISSLETIQNDES
jgi:hypothetical protein